jgi:thiol-disulfide isomerase/thioredoxin
MNKLTSLLTLAICSLIVLSCEEIPPTIVSCQTDRVVLVEEFTGVGCVACPAGATKLKEISAKIPGKVIVVAIHAGDFAKPKSVNGYLDLRCDDGEALEALHLGPVSAYPSATINRTVFPNESNLQVNKESWAGLINGELCNRPIANLAISSTTYDAVDSLATVTVEITPTSYFVDAVPQDLAITIMLTESGFVGYQLRPTIGYDSTYVHNHFLRDVITTSLMGDVIINKGNIITEQQKIISGYKIPAGWDPDHLSVVAFIHYKGSGDISVQQAVEKYLIPK